MKKNVLFVLLAFGASCCSVTNASDQASACDKATTCEQASACDQAKADISSEESKEAVAALTKKTLSSEGEKQDILPSASSKRFEEKLPEQTNNKGVDVNGVEIKTDFNVYVNDEMPKSADSSAEKYRERYRQTIINLSAKPCGPAVDPHVEVKRLVGTCCKNFSDKQG